MTLIAVLYHCFRLISTINVYHLHHLGLKCQCKYALDRKYYNVTVGKLTEFGCMVTYTEYGNSEEVPIQYLRPSSSNSSSSSSNGGGGGLKGSTHFDDKLNHFKSDSKGEA